MDKTIYRNLFIFVSGLALIYAYCYVYANYFHEPPKPKTREELMLEEIERRNEREKEELEAMDKILEYERRGFTYQDALKQREREKNAWKKEK